MEHLNLQRFLSKLMSTVLERIFIFGIFLIPALTWGGVLAPNNVAALLDGKYIVGEIQADIPAYPLFIQNKVTPSAKPDLVGYAFETIDLEPIRGYSGKPIDVLVVIDTAGIYRDVRLIEHKEPFFLTQSGTVKLIDFASQYIDLSLHHLVELLPWNESGSRDTQNAQLSGVHHGTVTARAINRSILSAASQVALAKLDPSLTNPSPTAKPQASQRQSSSDNYTPLTFDELVSNGLVTRTVITASNLKDLFANSQAPVGSTESFIDNGEGVLVFHTALLGDPLVGRNLLDEDGWRYITNKRRTQQALLITLSDPNHILDGQGKWKIEQMPFKLSQDHKEIQLLPIDFQKRLTVQTNPPSSAIYVLLIEKATPLNPAKAFDLKFSLQRRFGINFVLNKTEKQDISLDHRFYGLSAWWTDLRFTHWLELDWVKLWIDRQVEIGVLILGLMVLSVGLIAQKRVSKDRLQFKIFRTIYLVFTLFFIGWFAQGQLTILNITSAISSLSTGGDLSFLISDPISFILWIYVILSLFIWGRGTFCGWLCPFGALQELTSMVSQRLGLHQRRWRQSLDTHLKKLKYVILGLILLSMWLEPSQTDMLVKVEPFETAISFYFVNEWPYVIWALISLGFGTVIYKGYCRYICPLGAALATVNFLQRWSWIPRRKECGTPCQTCRYRCEYQAIKPTGEIDYAECFQCLDCVTIYQDENMCLPLVQTSNAHREISIKPVPVL